MLDKEFKYVFVSYKDGFGKNVNGGKYRNEN